MSTGLRVITKGDSITIPLRARGTAGAYFSVQGAAFETRILGVAGVLVIANSAHVADPDQVNNTGKFTLALGADISSLLKLGVREIITTVTQGSSIIAFRGKVLTVLDKNPT